MFKKEEYIENVESLGSVASFLANVFFSCLKQYGRKDLKGFFFNEDEYTLAIPIENFIKGTKKDFNNFKGSINEYLELFGLNENVFDVKVDRVINYAANNKTFTSKEYEDYLNYLGGGAIILKVKKGSYADNLMSEIIGNYEVKHKREGIFTSLGGLKEETLKIYSDYRKNSFNWKKIWFNEDICDLLSKEIYNKHSHLYLSLKTKRSFFEFPQSMKLKFAEMDIPLSAGVVASNQVFDGNITECLVPGKAYKVSIANLFSCQEFSPNLFLDRIKALMGSGVFEVNESSDHLERRSDLEKLRWNIGKENDIVRNDGVDIYLSKIPTEMDIKQIKKEAIGHFFANFSHVFKNIVPVNTVSSINLPKPSKTSQVFASFGAKINDFFDPPTVRLERRKNEIKESFCKMMEEVLENNRYKDKEIKTTVKEWSNFIFADDVAKLGGYEKKALEGFLETFSNIRRKTDDDFILKQDFFQKLKLNDNPSMSLDFLTCFFERMKISPEISELPNKMKLIFLKTHLNSASHLSDFYVKAATMYSAWNLYDNQEAVDLLSVVTPERQKTLSFVFTMVQEYKNFLNDEEFAKAKRSLGFITEPVKPSELVNLGVVNMSKALDLESLPISGNMLPIDRILVTAPKILQNSVYHYLGKDTYRVGVLASVSNYVINSINFKSHHLGYESFEKSINGIKKEYLYEVKSNVVLNIGEDSDKAKDIKFSLNKTFDFIVNELILARSASLDDMDRLEKRACNFLTASIAQNQINKTVKSIVRQSSTVDELSGDNDFKL